MKLEEYKSLNLKHGTMHNIKWSKILEDKDVLKGFKGGRITKETVGVFRIGVTYENMNINKDKITGSLPYGYFEYSNEIIYSPSSDTYQLRLTRTGNPNHRTKTRWFLDGKEITKEELIEMNALASKQRENKQLTLKDNPVFNVKLKYIVSIN